MKKLDARKLLCPMPVIKVQDTIKQMKVNEELQVSCSDSGALNDILAWCRINGHQVLSCQENDSDIIIVIRVGET